VTLCGRPCLGEEVKTTRSRFDALLGLVLAAALPAALAAGAAPERPDLDAATLARVRAVLKPVEDFSKPEAFEAMAGGATTQAETFGRDAFSLSAANLAFEESSDFSVGNGLFRKLWATAPASTTASDGLGPLFNARGCQNCHLKDGRGRPPEPGADGPAESFVLGLSVPALEGAPDFPQTPSDKIIPEPTYGAQIQDFAAPGIKAEGRVRVAYEEKPVRLAGGETASLRVPTYEVTGLAYGSLDESVQVSPRVAPQMIGLGLIEAIHENDVLALEDPDDADGDGISGRANRAMGFDGEIRLGRFGWKAIQPGMVEQSAFAFSTDMGLSSPPVPAPHGDCTEAQPACLAAPAGAPPGGHEVPQDLLDLVAFYSRHLAVPARRDVDDPEVLAGKRVFHEAGCAACHTPKYVTSNDPSVPRALRKQLIWPYTDLLLHDMGEGLADHRPQGLASGTEWRTPPLWGIGLTQAVSGHTQFLHDGRARNLLEAVLWHGGEAAASRDRVIALPPKDRAALIRFLESL